MTAVWFVIPAHGRLALAAICFRQLARTCAALKESGVDAHAVVIAEDGNLEHARAAGLETVEHENQPLGAKWNSGYAFAAAAGADFVTPLGNDDFIDPALILTQLDADGEMRCCRLSAVVREDGRKLAALRIPYDGGDGVRMLPTRLLEPFGYRPCDDGANRAIDTTTLRRLTGLLGRAPKITYRDVHDLQLVDWKTAANLNSYGDCLAFASEAEQDPWEALAEYYPAVALAEMRAFYADRPPPSPSNPAAGAAPLPRRGGPVTSVRVTAETLATLRGRA